LKIIQSGAKYWKNGRKRMTKQGVDHGFPHGVAKASGKNKRRVEIISGKAEVRSRERLLFLFCRIFRVFLDM